MEDNIPVSPEQTAETTEQPVQNQTDVEKSDSDSEIDFTPDQRRKIGQILSAERNKIRDQIRSQFADYDELKTRLTEIERSKLSEHQRLQLERDEALKAKDDLATRLEQFAVSELKTRMFLDYKTRDGSSLPNYLMKYVTGSTEDEILQSIEYVANDFGSKVDSRKRVGSKLPAVDNTILENRNRFMNEHILAAAGRFSR